MIIFFCLDLNHNIRNKIKLKQGYYIAINPIGIYHSSKSDKYIKKCKPLEFKDKINNLKYEESIQCYLTEKNFNILRNLNYEIETG